MARRSEAKLVPVGSSIRVVARRTGIAAATLRVWERRYGFPVPERRPGGSRVYSDADVARLTLIAQAIAVGFRPGEVVPLRVQDLKRLVEGAIATPTQEPELTRPSSGAASVASVLGALLADDADEVRRLLRTAAMGLGPRSFVVNLAHPLLVRVGDLWEQGKLEVRHEHLATSCVSTQLRLLLGALDEGAGGSPSVLLATLPKETHGIALEMIGVYLAASHAAPRILGPDTPAEQIVAAAHALDADVVGLSFARGGDANKVRAQALAVRKSLSPRIELWLGGGGSADVSFEGEAVRLARSFSDIDGLLEESRKARLTRARAG